MWAPVYSRLDMGCELALNEGLALTQCGLATEHSVKSGVEPICDYRKKTIRFASTIRAFLWPAEAEASTDLLADVPRMHLINLWSLVVA